jgi:carbon-monoxide dehydrogenase large subunit
VTKDQFVVGFAPEMGEFGVGQSVKRFEDVRLLRGEGRFHADVNLPGQVQAVLVRSPHAHARIRAIDAAPALQAPGVLAVFTGADVARDGLGTMKMTLKRARPDGSPMFAPPHRGLALDRARHVGDAVAMVVAETRAQAEDAALLVRVDYEPLAVTDTAAAAEAGSRSLG